MLMSCSRVPRRVQSYNSPYFQTAAFVPLGSGKSGFESRRSDFYRYKLLTCLISRVLVHSRNQLPEFKSKSNMENSCRLRVCSTSFSCEMGGIETIQSPLKREAGIIFFQDFFFVMLNGYSAQTLLSTSPLAFCSFFVSFLNLVYQEI